MVEGFRARVSGLGFRSKVEDFTGLGGIRVKF